MQHIKHTGRAASRKDRAKWYITLVSLLIYTVVQQRLVTWIQITYQSRTSPRSRTTQNNTSSGNDQRQRQTLRYHHRHHHQHPSAQLSLSVCKNNTNKSNNNNNVETKTVTQIKMTTNHYCRWQDRLAQRGPRSQWRGRDRCHSWMLSLSWETVLCPSSTSCWKQTRVFRGKCNFEIYKIQKSSDAPTPPLCWVVIVTPLHTV